MGIDLYVGENQIRLTNAFHYNSFLNWAADEGDFPQILNHSPIHSSYLLDPDKPPTLYSGSVFALKREVEDLLNQNPPGYAEYILNRMLEGCKLAIETQQKMTMDDGAWEGE